MYTFFVCVSLAIACSVAAPTKDELMFEGPNDTATVESTVREARAAPSHIEDLVGPGVKDAFLYVYGDAENDDGDVHGYSKKMKDRGQDGYKHKDSFHKKDGDKYGYEKHAEYGQEQRAEIDNANDEGLKHANYEAEGGGDDGKESRKSYAVFEQLNDEEKKQPKKKIETDYSFFGDDGGSYYGDESAESDGEAEAEAESESAEVKRRSSGKRYVKQIDGDGESESDVAEESEDPEENEEAEEDEE